ncbi:MAG: N-6 DNA methylase [Candidatus Bathyarchaeota archaeon]|nr:N-6 DNA methylase [Candidatus Bathyarchaeota archaeon]
MDRELALKQVTALVNKYQEFVRNGRIAKYNEEMTKKDFILPLFEALGWETSDSTEVSAEEKISKMRVDYGFRINGIPKFFLEAKSFREDLDNRKFIEQAINYSWHKGCTWAVLTNFESLKIFNAEVKTEHPWLSQLKPTLHCSEFVSKFDELCLLSKESFENKLLDSEAEKWGKKSKKTSIDKQLLTDFTRFRSLLSKNITKLNSSKKITEAELDECVQRILDRLMFIRNAEDRELEPKTLIANYREWESKGKGNLIKSLRATFLHFDEEYNSKIFAKHLCDDLELDNEVLHEVIEGLYTTKDNETYDFSIIDADVLGTIYEQYLGHILRKTEKTAKVTENHAHRKEQGIYYTPPYITEYIVRQTLGKLLKNKKTEVEKIKILDPACGSGSFLIKAFDILNEYHRQNDKEYSQTQLDVSGIPFKTKSRILQNNIFGVDLDRQAVEIAQLNLLLKIAEKGHRLPLLERNIRTGNSLIDDPDVAGPKAFKWGQEFEEITASGGFDVIIGNPPYVRQEELSEIKPYLQANYETYHGMADLFVYFFEKELKLLKENGYFAMIVSSKWLRAGYGRKLREFLDRYWIDELIDFGDLPVFPDATIYPCIIIMRKINKPNPKIRICRLSTLKFDSLDKVVKDTCFLIDQSSLSEKEWHIQNNFGAQLLDKIRASGPPIGEYVNEKVYYGIKTGLNEAFIVDEAKSIELVKEDLKNYELIKPIISGAELKRYQIRSKKKFIIFARRGVNISEYPSLLKHLERYKAELIPKTSKDQKTGRKPGNYKWYEMQDPTEYYKKFEAPKILWGNLTTKASFTIDERSGYYVNNPACILPTNSRYILGILNSNLMSFFLKSICAERQGGFIEQKPVYVSQVAIKTPTKAQEELMTELVSKMLALNERLVALGDKLTDERTQLEQEIQETDAQIDRLVYELYSISDAERKVIEESLR